MAAKMCNTINQNIEPCDRKLVERYVKQFGTLLDNTNSDNSNVSQFPSLTQETSEESNERENTGEYMHPNAVWDRGKQQEEETAEYLRRLESSIETYLESLPPTGENEARSLNSQNLSTLNAYLLNKPADDDGILNDVDLRSFDSHSIKLRNTAVAAAAAATTVIQLSNNSPNNTFIRDPVETASLSNFHNVRDVLLNIHQRLEHFLKSNGTPGASPPSPSSAAATKQLESKIEDLKDELRRYVELINQKKESELRKFSENMSNHSKLVHMRNAFMKKEINPVCTVESGGGGGSNGSNSSVYDIVNVQQTDTVSYYSNDSISDFDKYELRRKSSGNCNGFMMKNCYDECSYMSNCCDGNSVQYYSMLINEERNDNLLNDPPPSTQPVPPPFLPPRYQEREKISLIYQSPDNIIKQWQQWQKYQLNTITITKPKKNKLVKLNLTKERRRQQQQHNRPYDIYSFTLDYHKTRLLQMKLEKERKIRFICRMFFYFFGVFCFVLVVVVVRSMFDGIKK